MVRVATTAKFPGTALAAADIGLFTNLEDADLVANVTSGAATIDVDDASPFAVNMWLSARSADGFEIVQVTAVDLALNRVTISRAKDGTIAVAHPQGRTFKATIPAVALNQMRDEQVAMSSFLGGGSGWQEGDAIYIDVNAGTPRLFQDRAFYNYDDANKILKAPHVRPEADNTRDLGTTALRYRGLYLGPTSLHILNAASDANDLIALGSAGLRFGAGGASALDVTLLRQAASVYEVTGSLAGSVRAGMTGAANAAISLRAAAADANAYAFLDNTGLNLGAGGVSAVDVRLFRGAADRLDLVSGDSFRLATDGSTGSLQFGAAGDVAAYRQAASVVEWTGSLAGSVRFGMSGAALPFLALRAAAADANPLAQVLTNSIGFGAGGVSAVDYVLARTGANTGTISGHLRPSANITYALGSATEIWTNVFSRVLTIDNADAGADVTLQANNAAQRATLAGHLSPSVDSTWDLGENAVRWANGYFDNVVTAALTSGHILPVADNTYDLGSASLRWRDIYVAPTSIRVIKTAGDANPSARLGDALLAFGAGGASATDVQYARQAASVTELTGSLAGSVRFGISGAGVAFAALRAAAADANPYLLADTAGISFGAGGASAVDVVLGRGAANRLDLASGDSFNIVSGNLQIGATTVFESDRDVAITLLPNADNTLNLGSAAFRWASLFVGPGSVKVINAASDANPIIQLGTAITFGAGGASATDVAVTRQAAAVLEHTGSLAGSVRLGMSGAALPFLALRAAAADANALVSLTSTGLSIGSGGVSAVDVTLLRTGANAATMTATAGFTVSGNVLPNADNTRVLGSSALRYSQAFLQDVRVLNASSDANPLYRFSSAGLTAGAGGASAIDVTLARQAASVLELTGSLAGSVRFGMSGAALPFLALRAAVADANALVSLTSTGLSLGAGGASAVDVTLLRTGANAATLAATSGLTLSGNLLPNADNTRDLGSTALNYANMYLKRTTGSVLFMGASGLITEDNAAFFWDNTNNRLGIGNAAPGVDVDIKRASAGGIVAFNIVNTDNTNALSRAQGEVQVGGASAGDPSFKYTVSGVTNFIHGIDNSDSDRWKLSFGDALGTGDLIIAASGALGFYGVAPVARPAAYTQTYATTTRTHAARAVGVLVNGIGLAQDLTIEDMPALQATPTGMVAGERTAIRNNFSDIAEQLIDVKADLENTAQVLNQLLDDLQSLGLLQ